MRTVGFDTATATTAVAALNVGAITYESGLEPGADGRPRHAGLLMQEIEKAATSLGGWESVDRLAVGIGPGTFTGLRIGISTARALAQGLAKPLIPVVTLEALAAGLEADLGPRLPVIDARRGEAFSALYDHDGEEIWPPFVASPEELAARITDLGSAPLAAGDGSLRFRDQLEDAGARVLDDEDGAHRLTARHLCRLAADREPVEPRRIEPMYLRRPDAELWRERQHG